MPENSAPASEELKSLPDVALGWTPWRWFGRMRQQADLLAEQHGDRRVAAIEEFLRDYPSDKQDRVKQAVRESLRTTYRTGTLLDILINRLQLMATIAILAVVPLTGIVAFFVGPSLGWLARLGAIVIALALAGLYFAGLMYLGTDDQGEKVFFLALVPFAIVVSVVATAPNWWSGAPGWLAIRWVHIGLTATAWCVAAVTLVCMAFWLAGRATDLMVSATIRRRHPEPYLINSLSWLGLELPYAADPRADFVKLTEDGAQTIERFWLRKQHAPYPYLHAEIARLARQIGAATREHQLSVAIGGEDPNGLREWLATLMTAVVTRDVATFHKFADDGSATGMKLALWRRIGRGMAALALLAFAVLLLVVAIWQPGLPNWLKENGYNDLAGIVKLDDQFRVALVGLVYAPLRLIVGLYGSVAAGQTEESGLSGFRVRRKRI